MNVFIIVTNRGRAGGSAGDWLLPIDFFLYDTKGMIYIYIRAISSAPKWIDRAGIDRPLIGIILADVD